MISSLILALGLTTSPVNNIDITKNSFELSTASDVSPDNNNTTLSRRTLRKSRISDESNELSRRTLRKSRISDESNELSRRTLRKSRISDESNELSRRTLRKSRI